MRRLFIIAVTLSFFIQSNRAQPNLVGNGSFEYFTNTASFIDMFPNEYVQCWHMVIRSPDIWPDPLGIAPTPWAAYDGTYFASFGAFNGNGCMPSLESIKTDIDIAKDKGYKLSLWMRTDGVISGYSATVVIELHNNVHPLYPWSCDWVTDGSQQILAEVITSSHPSLSGWSLVEAYFTANDDYSELMFYGTRPFDNYPGVAIGIDKVELIEYCDELLEVNNYNMHGPYYYGDYIEVSDDGSGIPYLSPLYTDYTHLMAGNYIELLPNFESYIPSGGEYFLAEIVPCVTEQTPTCTGGIPIIVPEDDFSDNIDYDVRSFSDTYNDVVNISIHSNILSAILNKEDVAIVNYVLYTIDGRIIDQKQNLLESRIDIEILSSGMYVLHVLLSDGSIRSYKIVM